MTKRTDHKKLFWQQPVNLLNSRREKWTLVIFSSVFVILFLLFFQPFGVNNYDPTHRIDGVFLLATVLFGLVGGFTLAIYEFWLAPVLFRRSTRRAFLSRLALCLLILASVLFLFYNLLGNFHDWRLKSYLEFIQNVTLMGTIPIGITLLYLENRKVKTAYERSRNSPQTDTRIRLTSENGREHLALSPEQLLYIEAQGNYVFVYHLESGTTRKSLLRTTMKKLERQLDHYAIMRCHRSFLVNTRRVGKVTGNAHQLQLHLSGAEDTVPVSRSYIPALEAQLDVHPV